MNCKPGDLAVVVGGRFPQNVGKLVRVIEPQPGRSGAWLVECLASMASTYGVLSAGAIATCFDAQLRPIRDPGDDAVDETLQWLPAPSKEVAHG